MFPRQATVHIHPGLFVRRAESAGRLNGEAANAFRRDYGVEAGRPLADTAREAVAGIRAKFFEKHAGTPEALATLHRKMADPDFKATFNALFPGIDTAQRQAIERLSQAAQIWARRNVAGSTAGQQALAAEVGRRAIGPVAGAVARVLAMVTPRWLAENYAKPGFTAMSSWLIGAAAGNVGKVPAAVEKFLSENTQDEFAQPEVIQ